MRRFILSALFAPGLITNAFPEEGTTNTAAQTVDKILEPETVVVSGQAVDHKNREINSRSLKRQNLVDFSEILSDEMVEVSMIRKGAYGNDVSVRGFGQENFKVLLDGGILEGACGGRKDPHLSHINMLTVQKLTMQQGPFDVTQMGALGGYVDVITKKPEPGFNGEVLGKIGSYGYYSGGTSISGGDDKIQGLFGYNYSESGQYEDGDGNEIWTFREGQPSSYNEDGEDANSFQRNDIWGKLQFTPGENQTILLEHTYGKADDILSPRSSMDTEEEITNLSKASWEMRDLGSLSEKLTLSFYRNEVDHRPYQKYRDVAVPKNNEVESVITGGGIQNVTETDFAVLTYGLDVYHRDWWGDVYNSDTGAKLNDDLIPSVQSVDVGGYIQIDKDFDSFSLGAGLRYDHFQQEADENLVYTGAYIDGNRQTDDLLGGNISGQFFLNDSTMIFGGIGRNYRTPTSTERYIQGNTSYFGNPDLKPTANTEFDLGIRYEFGRWMFQTKGFYSDLKDYIYQESNLDGYKSYTNIDAHMYGGDIKARVDLLYGLSVDGGIAYQKGRKDSFPDNNTDRDLGQVAPLKSKLALNYNKDHLWNREETGLFGTIEWVHSDEAADIDADAGEQNLSAWDIMNLRAGFRFRSCTLNAGVDNVFDRTYAMANSYEWDVVSGTASTPVIVNEPGRFFYASLAYTW
ncbi:TonB-dependent receptor [Verrucomicrobia bacterium S94]|nr:TonB-dependent receptor [Verrucomicrobia bacterium S94]